ncbi:MAG: HAMP domain-containing histidine kinase [Chloroflexi bacterium]|nr:HAMP domain-containing histidine kinase [Chloroflexota bacterium]
MSRNVDAPRPLRRLALPWLGAALALTLATGSGLLLAQALMEPPPGEQRSLAAYLALAGAATMAGGWLALRLADGLVGLPIQAKAFLGSTLASGVALLNVFIVAQFMFVSTSHDLKLLVALLAFSAVVTLFFSLWVASTVASRLEAVAAAIRELASGRYDSRLDVAGGDEVAALARDVDSLAERLRQAEGERAALDRERRDLTTAISHDLRTPLASVRAMVEALDDGIVRDAEEVARYYCVMRREIERLSGMIDDLFELARLEAGALRLDKQPLALQEVAAEVVDAMQAQAKVAGIDLRLEVKGEPPHLPLDGARIERALSNLVRNALQHTPVGGWVKVMVFAEDGWVSLRVADSGEGIDRGELERIWARFYRGDKSRQRAKGGDGAGLGLAIVRGVVAAHSGQVAARSSPGRGATFEIRLPREV